MPQPYRRWQINYILRGSQHRLSNKLKTKRVAYCTLPLSCKRVPQKRQLAFFANKTQLLWNKYAIKFLYVKIFSRRFVKRSFISSLFVLLAQHFTYSFFILTQNLIHSLTHLHVRLLIFYHCIGVFSTQLQVSKYLLT